MCTEEQGSPGYGEGEVPSISTRETIVLSSEPCGSPRTLYR